MKLPSGETCDFFELPRDEGFSAEQLDRITMLFDKFKTLNQSATPTLLLALESLEIQYQQNLLDAELRHLNTAHSTLLKRRAALVVDRSELFMGVFEDSEHE